MSYADNKHGGTTLYHLCGLHVIPVYRRRWDNAGLMLGQRRRQCANIILAVSQRLVLTWHGTKLFQRVAPYGNVYFGLAHQNAADVYEFIRAAHTL